MATAIREFTVAAPLEKVWSAVSAFGEVHIKLAKGFVTDSTLKDDIRTIRFANGMVAREKLISLDSSLYYLSYSAMSDKLEHHHASMHLAALNEKLTTIKWVTDLKPDALIASLAPMMDEAIIAIKNTLES